MAERTEALNGTVPIAYPLFMATLPSSSTTTSHPRGLVPGTSDPHSLAYTRISRPMYPRHEMRERFAMRDSQESVHV